MKFTGLGYEWTLQLNFGLIQDIKDQTGIDLDTLLSDAKEFSKVILANPRKLIELLWVICEPQAEKNNVDAKAFGYMFNRETIDKAGDALIESIVDFYQRSSAGKVIRQNIPAILAKMDQKIQEVGNQQVKEALSNLDTNTQVSSVG